MSEPDGVHSARAMRRPRCLINVCVEDADRHCVVANDFLSSLFLFHFLTKISARFSSLETSAIGLTFDTMCTMSPFVVDFFSWQSDLLYWGFRSSDISRSRNAAAADTLKQPTINSFLAMTSQASYAAKKPRHCSGDYIH